MDVSNWNPVTDWRAVRGNGVSFCSFKLTEGTGFTDTTSPGRVPLARAAGIIPGGYHFARPGDVAGQAARFAGQLRATGLLDAGALAPMLDVEAAGLRANANGFVRDFIRHLRAETGVRRVLVYANASWYSQVLRPDEWADDDVWLWVAHYNGDPGRPGWAHPRLALHQHTQNGTVPGIPGFVDRNATVGGHTLAQLILGGASPSPNPLEDTSMLAPAGTDEHADIIVKDRTRLYVACSWGQTVDVSAILFYGDTNPDGSAHGVGGGYNGFERGEVWRFDPNRPGPVEVPAGAAMATVRYTAAHSFGLGAA
ncbi:glycoside hydrolase family 25 protein [Amycolatopsis samaneae]|uniref:Glycoside hydrolase family 25 protein n=1 Tax=Amycolatopsis samaneae TaxID=664691 RepID=A0ABW5GAX9_9PSEU